MLADLLLAYKQVKGAREREKSYRRMIGKAPDYTLIREIANNARYDVVMTVTFVDGSKIDFRRADPTDRLRQLMDPDKAGSW